MTTIGTIGLGLFLLIIIWIVALVVFVVGVKLQSNISWIALGSATAFTVLLLIIPLDKKQQIEEETEIHDKDFSIIYKNLLLIFLLLSCIIGFISFFVLHCIEPVRPKPIKSFYHQD